MHVAIVVAALVSGSSPSAGLIAAFGSGLQLTLGQDSNGPPPGSAYPPPPPLVETPPLPKGSPQELPPPPIVELPEQPLPPPGPTAYPPPPGPQAPRVLPAAEPPAATSGSIPVAYWEAFGADLGLRLVFESVATFFFAVAALEFSPPCNGTPNPALGVVFLIPGMAAVVGQPFALAAITGAIFRGQGHSPKYWTSFWGDVLATLVAAPLAGLLLGELTNLATNSGGDNTGPAIAVGITTFVLAGAFGAPTAASLSLPSTPAATVPAPRAALGVPLIRLSFD